MPVIEDTSQASAIALQQCLSSVPDNEGAHIVSGHGAGFLVDQATYDCWETKDLGTMVLSDCRSNAPCYSAQCAEDVITEPPTLASLNPPTNALGAPTVITLTGTNFVAPMTVSFDPPGAEAPLVVNATVTSPTTATANSPIAAVDTAGAVAVTATTPYGTTAAVSLTVA